MGYNTSVIILNDCLNDIRNDPDFGRNLADSICALRPHHGGVSVRSGSCANAATAIETHHSNTTAIIAVGGNRGDLIEYVHAVDEDNDLPRLRTLAAKYGYELNKI